MSPCQIAFRLALGIILVVSVANPGLCGDREELLAIAGELREAIEQRSRDGVLKYIHGQACFMDDCYSKGELENLLKDDACWPSQLLFGGEDSMRHFFLTHNNLTTRMLPVDWDTGAWQIMLMDPTVPYEAVPYFFLVKDATGWRLTYLLFE